MGAEIPPLEEVAAPGTPPIAAGAPPIAEGAVVLVADAHTTAGNAVLSPQQVIAHHNLTLTHIVSFGPQARALPTQRVVQMLRP